MSCHHDHDRPDRFFELPATRREFLRLGGKGLGILAFAEFIPQFLVDAARAQVPAPGRDKTILVLVQLGGGNDGMNTVLPDDQTNYERLRTGTGTGSGTAYYIPRSGAGAALSTGAGVLLHPSLTGVRDLMNEGKLCVVQNVGYPNPNRSHFRSMEIWETASNANEFRYDGWIGRYLNANCAGMPTGTDPDGMHAGSTTPQAFLSAGSPSLFGFGNGTGNFQENTERRALLETLVDAMPTTAGTASHFLRQTYLDSLVTERKVSNILTAYRQQNQNYPASTLAQSLRNVAGLIAANMETRIYFVSIGGFDTHTNQLGTHATLLGNVSQALTAFQRDLESKGLANQVLTMTFSEFGRRPTFNLSAGTDHGTAAPLFVMGGGIKKGVVGSSPRLDNVTANGDITFSTDFRQVYATVLDKWLNCSSAPLLGGDFANLDFL